MNNVKAPYSINKLTIEVASAAITNLTLFETNKQNILTERTYLIDKLSKLTHIVKYIYHTDSNSILFVVSKALEIYKIMADRGIVVRFRSVYIVVCICIYVYIVVCIKYDVFTVFIYGI